MPLIYCPKEVVKKREYIVVSHYSNPKGIENELSTATKNYTFFIDTLVTAKRVISDSLHGVILAEAYGIPAIWLKSDIDEFKFKDYYQSTGRMDIEPISSIEEAIAMPLPKVPNLNFMRKKLLEVFPNELYQQK